MSRVLIDAGAEIDVLAAGDAGGVPGGSALLHAAVFGNTEVVDVLAAAGAQVRSLVEAAAVGNIGGRLTPASPLAERERGLTMAAAHDRVEVIEELLRPGRRWTPWMGSAGGPCRPRRRTAVREVSRCCSRRAPIRGNEIRTRS